jgi:hypothetical protein
VGLVSTARYDRRVRRAALLKAYGWSSILYLGGVLPVLLAIALAPAVPESLRFLALRETSQARVRSIVAQIIGHTVPADAQFTAIDHTKGHAGVRSLFFDGRLTTTLLLWVVFCITFTILVFIPLKGRRRCLCGRMGWRHPRPLPPLRSTMAALSSACCCAGH